MVSGQESKAKKGSENMYVCVCVGVNIEKAEVGQWIVSHASTQFYWREGGMLEHYQEWWEAVVNESDI